MHGFAQATAARALRTKDLAEKTMLTMYLIAEVERENTESAVRVQVK